MIEVLTSGRPIDPKGRYLHWDEMRHRTPPDGLTLDEWWMGTAYSRFAVARPLPLTSVTGEPFRISNIDPIQEAVHRIDQYASGQIQADGAIANVQSSDRYLVSSLMEEAITSSLLEGAATTRRAAKEMLRTKRSPKTHGERMVFNNFNAMIAAEQLAREGRPLTPGDVLELHRIVTDGTLDDESESGRIQQPGEERVVVVDSDDTVIHRPPPAEELPGRLEQLCEFANGENVEGFLHPVVRAIVLHFWVGYDHPFVDGNGRTARALFYWSILRSGYWLAQYISISAILRNAPGQYKKSYLKAETDSNDATYFVIYQLQVMEQAIDSLRDYLARKTSEINNVKQRLRSVSRLNNRQLAIINDALHDPSQVFTIQGQAQLHRVVYQSARTDLLALEAMGLFAKAKLGNQFEFYAVGDIQDRLHHLVEAEKQQIAHEVEAAVRRS
ncbi:Fic family protein [Candidatus Poriferisocius sp.]|uniref:Fic family protein n=1 Tax=Candidatus Poriferisocius sp. TaxID=3101276 RepID=UPI003B019C43